MTRIIAGIAAQTTLQVPQKGTRPTSERVREAVFAALEARDAIDGARVLDLFAGTGALGLEAASRGATSVTLVESAKPAAAIARKNAEAVAARRAARAEVAPQRAQRWLADTPAEGTAFDLVLIDPPYDLPTADLAETLSLLVPHLAEHAVILLEQAKRADDPQLPEGLELERTKRYGDTLVHTLRVA